MRAAPARPTTKVFGMQLGASPGKLAVLGLLGAVAAVFLIHNAITDQGPPSSSTAQAPTPSATTESAAEPVPQRAALHTGRRRITQNESNSLRLRPIDARKGDIDPTLRLDLLARLQSLPFAPSSRSLFEAGPAPLSPEAIKQMAALKINPGPKPPPMIPTAPVPPQIPPIPLKFYGFIQPKGVTGPNRGFFLEGDNILVGAEGQVLLKKYKIVQLSANSAVMEDTTSNHRETLILVPEAPNAM
jgi:hypothetical protein